MNVGEFMRELEKFDPQSPIEVLFCDYEYGQCASAPVAREGANGVTLIELGPGVRSEIDGYDG